MKKPRFLLSLFGKPIVGCDEPKEEPAGAEPSPPSTLAVPYIKISPFLLKLDTALDLSVRVSAFPAHDASAGVLNPTLAIT